MEVLNKIWKLFGDIEKKAASIAKVSGTRISFHHQPNESKPAFTDKKLQEQIAASAKALGLTYQFMPDRAEQCVNHWGQSEDQRRDVNTVRCGRQSRIRGCLHSRTRSEHHAHGPDGPSDPSWAPSPPKPIPPRCCCCDGNTQWKR